MNANGSNQTRVTNNGYVNSLPSFSPDSTRIAFVNRISNNPDDIFAINPDGTNEKPLTNNYPISDFSPSWGRAFVPKIVSITRPANNTVHLQCLGFPSVVNRIESSPDLSPGSFAPLLSAPPAADVTGAFQFDDTNAGTKKFYRFSPP
jgi:hypothetical protein